ncbi:MAG: DUF6538 domain-containing protein [Desulfomicrobium sp.]
MSATSKNARQKGFSYLLIKGSSVHFRISVPPLLRPIFGCTEFHRSLGTRLLREAKPIAAILGARLGMLFRDTVKRITKGEIVDTEKLNILVHDMLDSELSRLDRESTILLQGSTFVERTARRLWLESTAKSIMSSLDSERIVNAGLELIKIACNSSDKDTNSINKKIVDALGNRDISNFHAQKDSTIVYPDRWSAEDMFAPVRLERAEREELSSAKMDALEIARGLNTARGVAYKHAALKIDSGNRYSVDAAHESLSNYYPLLKTSSSCMLPVEDKYIDVKYPLVCDEIYRYIEHCESMGGSVGTLDSYRDGLKHYRSFVGIESRVNEINDVSVKRYVECLKTVPANKGKKYRETNIRLFAGIKDLSSKPKLMPSTIKTNIEILNGFLTFLLDEYDGQICKTIKKAKVEADRSIGRLKKEIPSGGARASFSDADLLALFYKDDFLWFSEEDPALFWCPLISLFTGCRIEDVVTLKRGEIKITPDELATTTKKHEERDGIPFIDLTNINRIPKLKEESSRRTIPIHPFVWDVLGFKKFVSLYKNETDAHKNTFLFPHWIDEKKSSKPKVSFSNKFSAYCEAHGIGQRGKPRGSAEKKSFHSFRNTILTAFDRTDGLVPQGISSSTIGHASKNIKMDVLYIDIKSVTEKYDKGIMYLNFEDRIPLIELADSYWTRHKKPIRIAGPGQNRKTKAPWRLRAKSIIDG